MLTPRNAKKCVEACLKEPLSIGCHFDKTQYYGCFAHTQRVARGSGSNKAYCWVFSKCKSKPCALFLNS